MLLVLRTLKKFSSKNLPEFGFKPAPYTGLQYSQAAQLRKKHMFQSYFHYYKEPLYITDGRMQYLFDHTGRRYLDLVAGIATISVGHCHPRITKIIQEQCQKLIHTSTIYLNEHHALYCQALAKKAPKGLDVVFLTNSGSEANDLAIMLARMYTKNMKIVTLRNAYHGNVMGMTNINNWNHGLEKGFAIQKASYPGAYRCNYKGPDPGQFYANDVAQLIESTTSGSMAGWLSQPIMGAGGIVPMPEGYLKKVYEIVRKHKGICIADQVQTGFGRIGTKYWGCLDNDAHPDMMTMAKGIGNGMPLGAVITSKEIADSISGKLFFNTFSAGPIQCRVGMQVLKIIEEDNLPSNAEKVGGYLIENIKKLGEKTRYIGEVRGKGMMMAMEFVKDRESKTPDLQTTNKIFEKLRQKGVLIGKGGPYGTILRAQPPMCMNQADAQFVLSALQQSFNEIK